jgi:hypothetical protein
MSKLIFDLRRTLEPYFGSIYAKLLELSGGSVSADILTQVLEALSSLLRYILPTSPNLLKSTYLQFVEAFRKCNPEIQRACGEVWGSLLRKLKGQIRETGVLAILEHLGEHDGALEAWTTIAACKVRFINLTPTNSQSSVGCLSIVTQHCLLAGHNSRRCLSCSWRV